MNSSINLDAVAEASDCPKEIAEQVVNGSRQPDEKFCYIAGPMRGRPENNFVAFDKARDLYLGRGWTVISSPADIDRAAGHELLPQTVYAFRDFWAIYLMKTSGCSCMMLMLEGWEGSLGATAEHALARWMEIEVVYDKDEKGANE